jgi:hypothetical protein
MNDMAKTAVAPPLNKNYDHEKERPGNDKRTGSDASYSSLFVLAIYFHTHKKE